MTGLPKSIIKKYGISKKAWAVYRGGHSRSRSVSTMKRKKGYRRARARSWLHRRRPKLISIPPTVGLIGGAVAGSSGGWTSPIQAIMNGNPMEAVQTGIRNVTGLQIGMPGCGYSQGFRFNVFDTLNPFNMEEAVGLKSLFWGSVISAGLRIFGINRRYRDAVKQIPFLKKTSL